MWMLTSAIQLHMRSRTELILSHYLPALDLLDQPRQQLPTLKYLSTYWSDCQSFYSCCDNLSIFDMSFHSECIAMEWWNRRSYSQLD